MSKHERKPELTGLWRALHAVIWLAGLAILAWGNWWWPGILVLVAISVIYEAILRQYAPQAFEEEGPLADSDAVPAPQAPPSPQPSNSEYPLGRLPSVCAKCGGPIRGYEVKWTSLQSADCPYCGANLPLERP